MNCLFTPFFKHVIILLGIYIVCIDTCTAQKRNAAIIKLEYNSEAIWRDDVLGFQTIQSSVNYTFKNSKWRFTLDNSIPLMHTSNAIEITPSLIYAIDLKEQIKAMHGVIYYVAGETDDTTITFEFFESLSFPSFVLSPVITVYYSDIHEIYSTVYVLQKIPLKKKRQLSIYGTIGYRIGSMYNKNGFRECTVGSTIPIHIRNRVFKMNLISTFMPKTQGKNTYFTFKIATNL
jgi:hypothetical protein